ncbi:hypothetical protein OG689_08765 [Kitasatospora sp. NBC_00240]|uniref:hypothetical protein n=1 Tax=Kitasatospora sp. NBC_00240 TaxID=2903567 RepID=UPI00225786E0|nr:hypothetical protein [Kitasatospora sp. NBC_00240]MCX5209372.1 hypothetical protein [Kitasatospora sp. NBC_00240]
MPESALPFPQSAPPLLEGSAREVLKGTLVPVDVTPPESTGGSDRAPAGGPAGGLVKYVAVRQLALSHGDGERVADRLRAAPGGPPKAGTPVSARTFEVLAAFEDPLVPALEPDIATVATIPAAELEAFAGALAEVRTDLLRQAQDGPSAAGTDLPARALNSVLVALKGLGTAATPPVGLLNLERIEMVPNGIERGELVATIPMAPGEETAVTHTEWSVTSKEFTTIVTDSLEEVSETGVTDNTDLSQSTGSQSQHSNQFNITGTVQGGIPVISGSSTSGFTAQDSGSKSATESIKHARTTTARASSRSRREHKVTISTRTETGTSEVSTRILRNASPQPVRVDYFSLMRKWRVRLYRYGLRLTYDIVVPEPGAAMRRAYAELEALRAQQGQFEFTVKPSDVTTAPVGPDGNPAGPGDPGVPRYRWLADRYGATVRTYPVDPAPVPASAHVGTNGGWWFLDLEFDVPGTARIREIVLDAHIGKQDGDDNKLNFDVIGTVIRPEWNNLTGALVIRDQTLMATPTVPFLHGHTGHQKVTCFFHHSDQVFVGLNAFCELTQETVEQWRAEVWTALHDAAQAQYFARQQDIAAQILAIEEKLAGVDTLTLRREENDEIMKSVLRFILGPGFAFMPDEVLAAFQAAGVDLAHGIGFDGAAPGLDQDRWTLLRRHEELVRFINQAIEWENVVTFLYSYFWDVPPSWRFVRELRHPDANRQAFLRAGSARIVLTVRKGWEERWMRFAEGGSPGAEIPPAYLSIAQEIAAYDDRNYPGIPPANPGRTAARLQDAVYTTSAANLVPSPNPVTFTVERSTGFVVGLPVVLDTEDDRHVQESVRIVAIPSQTQITVERVQFAHRGTTAPFAVLQPGEKGALIAEWNEYTPTSGTDIAMTSDLPSIA